MITAVDAHACGEPGRVITGGVLDPPGATMFEKMKYFERHADHIRLRMLREPRGYPAANCNLILPPTHPEADAGFVIMEQVEYPPMSGTNTICVVTVLIETGMVPVVEPLTKLKLDTPAGLIEVEAEVRDGKVRKVTFRNVPAFATHLDAPVEVQGLGTVTVDVAYGGMFYVIADAAPLGFRLAPDEARDIVRVAEMIKAAAREQLPVAHPENPEIAGHHHRPAFRRAVGARTRIARTRWWFPPERSIGRGPPHGPARSTARPAAPEPAPKWRRCTPKASCRCSRISSTKASWEPRSPAG